MARYDLAGGRDEEFEPGSRNRVLRNLLGITRVRDIQAAETDALVQAQFWSYQEIGDDECFSSRRLCELHRKWLGSIYPFAGEYRDVNISKGVVLFSPAYLIQQNLFEFEESLLSKLTPCRAESHEDLARQLAMVHAELILIHPFREGNGRHGRWLANLMSLQAGYTAMDFGFAGKGSLKRRTAYFEALGSAFRSKSYEPLATVFLEALHRSEKRGHSSNRSESR